MLGHICSYIDCYVHAQVCPESQCSHEKCYLCAVASKYSFYTSHPVQVNFGLLSWWFFLMPPHGFPSRCFLQGAVLGWLWRWRSGLCLVKFNHTMRAWIFTGISYFKWVYIYIYVWIYTYTLISVITENLSVYMKQKLYKYLEICLLMHLSFLGVDYIHGLGFARSAKKYEKKDPGTVAPSAKPKAKPDGTGTDASNGSAPVPKRRRRAAAWWYIYFLVEHYTSNTEIIGMIAGNLWNQVQV